MMQFFVILVSMGVGIGLGVFLTIAWQDLARPVPGDPEPLRNAKPRPARWCVGTAQRGDRLAADLALAVRREAPAASHALNPVQVPVLAADNHERACTLSQDHVSSQTVS